MLKSHKVITGVDDFELAHIFNMNRATINAKINQSDLDWKLGELLTFCAVLGVDKKEVTDTIGRVVEVVYGTTNKKYKH